jgi:hypothetical protein
MLGDHPGQDYFPLALAIAERLGWTAYDEQSGEPVSRQQVDHDHASVRKPWWKVW